MAVRGGERDLHQWDSWRFWESLAAGCVTVHADFDACGFRCPAMPDNWTHYVGIDPSNIDRDVDRLFSIQAELGSIAEAGKRWAIENYGPAAVARRFLSEIAS
jgi:hypothetical protein